MAFVKLPQDIRYLDVSKALGGRRKCRLEFAVYAGSALPGVAADDMIELASPWGAELFEADDLPIVFREGDVGAVMAIIPPTDESGPIISSANLDRDERADFLTREDAIWAFMHRALGGQSRFQRVVCGVFATAWAGIIGALAYLAANFWEAGVSIGFEDRDALAAAALAGLLEPNLLTVGAAALGVVTTLLAAILRGALRAQADRARRREALDLVWDTVAEAMAFVQAHADMFRSRPAAGARSTLTALSEEDVAHIEPTPSRIDGQTRDGRRVAERVGDVRPPSYLAS